MSLEIKTVKVNEGEVSFCPKRGGLITSLKLDGQEILYFDQETFDNLQTNVRGGIPILFPNAGELSENLIYPNLGRHGFARDLVWQGELGINSFEEKLSANQETQSFYPYDFCLRVRGQFEIDGSFSLIQAVENKGEKDLPVAMGLHPYFKVADLDKQDLKFNFLGGQEIEDQIAVWQNGGTIYLKNPKLTNAQTKLEIEIPKLGTLIIDISPEYESLWIWSLPGKDFFCLEPMLRDQNGLIDKPQLVCRQETFSAQINIKLKNNLL